MPRRVPTNTRRSTAKASRRALELVGVAGVGLGTLLLGEALARALDLRVAPPTRLFGALAVLVGASVVVVAVVIVVVVVILRNRAVRLAQTRAIVWNALTPPDFEREVARLFARAGLRVRLVGATGDGGVDVRVWPSGRFAQTPGIVQCKRYAVGRVVGPATVRELIGARTHERAATAWLATTGRLTTGARRLAAAEGIVVLDVTALAKLDRWLLERTRKRVTVGTLLAPSASESPELLSRDSLRPPLRR